MMKLIILALQENRKPKIKREFGLKKYIFFLNQIIIIKRKINKSDEDDFQDILENGDNIPNINNIYINDEIPYTQKMITIKILRKLIIIFLIIIA